MCVYFIVMLCVGRFGLSWAHDAFKFCMSYAHAFPCIRTFNSFFIFWYIVIGTFLILSLFLSYVSLFLWHLNINLLRPRTLCVLWHLLPLTLHLLLFGFVMMEFERISRRIFVDEALIRNATSFYRTFLTLTYPLSFTIGVRSHFVTSQSLVPPWSYSNMHGIDTSVPHFFFRVWGTRIVITQEIVSEVLHVPKVVHFDYPGYEHLRIVSKDELASHFCETPSSWDDHQNTLCLGFAKGPRFLNMVMTFILHTLSHYNSITEPHARFLLSLLEDISIDLSHFILSLIDVYRDTATRDKLIFPSAITQILRYFCVPFLVSSYFSVMGAI